MLETHVLLAASLLIIAAQLAHAVLMIYTSAAEVSTGKVPRGSTVVLVCTGTPTPQQVDYQWECPNPPCDGQYRKVYGNVLVVVATSDTSGRYRCRPDGGTGDTNTTRNITLQKILTKNKLAIYNNGTLILQNTLFTSPEQIPNELNCTTGKNTGFPRFRRENGSTEYNGLRSVGQSILVPPSSLQPNGQHSCGFHDGSKQVKFYSYFNKFTLPTPQVWIENTTTPANKLRLLLVTPLPFKRGRFILRYDCVIGEAEIAVQYRSVDARIRNSTTTTTRDRPCFVVGEISRVTVWYTYGANISTAPAVVTIIKLPEPGHAHEVSLSTFLKMRPKTAATSDLKTIFTGMGSKMEVTSTTVQFKPTCYEVFPTSACLDTTAAQVSDNKAIIIGATTANLLILLLSITLLVISGVLIVKIRKRHTSTLYSTPQVTYDQESRESAVQIYDEVTIRPETIASMKLGHDYQDLDIMGMNASNQYSDIQ